MRELPRIRIVNEGGMGYGTRVWINDMEVTASLSRLTIDAAEVVAVTLTLPIAALDFMGEGFVTVEGRDGTTGTVVTAPAEVPA